MTIELALLRGGDGRDGTIGSIVNPDKLGHLGPVESLRDVLDEARES